MKIEFVAAVDAAEILAVPVFEDRTFTAAGTALDGKANGALTKAAGKGRFTGKAGQSLSIAAPAGVEADAVLLVGAGAKDKLDDLAVEAFGGNAYAAVKLSGAEVLTIDASDLSPEQAARVGFAARLAAYRFDKYRTTQKADKIPSITTIRVVTTDLRGAEAALEPLSAVADGVIFARDLVSEPANVLYPAEFAKRVKALESLGLEVEILGEAEMEKLGMRTLLGVGQGSRRESQLAIMKWNGGEAGAQPLAFVGKGVCFDTGGISIKPAEGMEDMKWDMGGAAAVTGTMIALASRKAKANVIGVLGLVENMPDGNAQRPGDVVVSMSGQTVEVINTDAEGRLVLADALWYTQERFKPKFMIDLATLTGAMIVALGLDYAGVFSNSDDVADPILAAAKKVGENFWRMPIPAIYEQHIDSKIADVKNTGNGRAGGSITAALFLQRFTNGVPWAHLDIAPTAWANKSPSPTVPEGGVGFAVRTLDRMVADSYEG
ncbi:leucyl aminopeptidase [Brevundimonas vesicularis]|uniref:Leucyl aminopeptidase n=1 Tax=Brevundimonas nasdae TaxID=172043 RepID=A0ACD4VIF9_9CAUL|nr:MULTISPECIES: leucyl aminopeptidase [Brevundimonas]MCW0047247.1 leucyl aminopeptidase [Brevundimonas sp. BT-123]MDQ1192586.1 leucyl aminopeptidase [Brevundimonas vesicularis]WOB77360.1 leucyl aminopeptidase [Brevundimonas nasdae]